MALCSNAVMRLHDGSIPVSLLIRPIIKRSKSACASYL